ncbi:MAG TPA: hypothetical protein VGF06_16985 [Terriglobales bacterium]|jgi:hypothetical protein
MSSSGRSYAGLLVLVATILGLSATAHAIPAFARKYGLPCSACHEAWPKLNSFGQNFKDNGYQIMNERDAPIDQSPSYWPVAMRITPHWHFESAGNTTVDTSPTERSVNTSGFDLTGIDILAAGTLANNVSFLLVPSIDPGDGTVGFESANVRLDNLWHSPWLNFKFGKFELDLPLSEKRMMTLSNVGGIYQLYHFAPPGDAINDEVASFGENQLGVELMGHSRNDHGRYSVSLISSTNGTPGLLGGRSYDGYVHFSQGFVWKGLGLQRVGAYAWVGQRSTYFLTSGGDPIPGTGQGNRSFSRIGGYASLYFGKFDVTGVYQYAIDNSFLANGVAATDALPLGSQAPKWNTGTIEAHYVYSPQLFIIGRYELVRMSRQVNSALPSDLGNTDVFTLGYRYYPFMHSRAGLAWHQEFATLRSKLTSDTGQDQRFNSYFMGFDFAF